MQASVKRDSRTFHRKIDKKVVMFRLLLHVFVALIIINTCIILIKKARKPRKAKSIMDYMYL